MKKTKIILVDGDLNTHALFDSILTNSNGDLLICPTGELALLALENYAPDLILLSTALSDMDGFGFCRRLKQSSAMEPIPVIFLSELNDPESKVRAFDLGAVDYVAKPFHTAELRSRIALHIRLSNLQNRLETQQLVEKKIWELSEAQQATIFALAKLAEQRDEDTGDHLERVREYCRLLAKRLGEASPYSSHISQDFIECIQHASPLHDIGKVAIPDSILLKSHKLTPAEFEVMKTHTIIGAENMQLVYNCYSGNTFIGMGIEIALYHHERWDGTGYPDGLVGRNIPLSARIMALADVYDALRSDRCYRKGFSHEQATLMIQEGDGTHFDPVVVEAFLEIEALFRKNVYPVDLKDVSRQPGYTDGCESDFRFGPHPALKSATI